jgi:hypothetical protein
LSLARCRQGSGNSGRAYFNETLGSSLAGTSGTCRLNFKRIDATEPNDVDGCEGE